MPTVTQLKAPSHLRKLWAERTLSPLARTASASMLALLCSCGTSKVPAAQPSTAQDNQPPIEESVSKPVPVAAPTKIATPAISLRRDRASAAAEAITESNKAAAASAIALKASQEAAKAAAQAAKAAAQAAALATPSSRPTAPQVVLYSIDDEDQARKRQQVARTIEGLDHSLQSIDHGHQSADGLSRIALAEKFLQSAREAFAEGSYDTAESLADKASAMIRPLTGNSNLPIR